MLYFSGSFCRNTPSSMYDAFVMIHDARPNAMNATNVAIRRCRCCARRVRTHGVMPSSVSSSLSSRGGGWGVVWRPAAAASDVFSSAISWYILLQLMCD